MLRHRRLLVVAALTVVVLVVAGGLVRAGSHDPCETPAPAPRSQLVLLPSRLSFARIGTITRVGRDPRYLTLSAVSAKPIDELTILIQDAVTAAGYRPAGMDNEGFEAEVFFTTGRYAAGQARVRHSACKGRWDIALVLLDRRGRSSSG